MAGRRGLLGMVGAGAAAVGLGGSLPATIEGVSLAMGLLRDHLRLVELHQGSVEPLHRASVERAWWALARMRRDIEGPRPVVPAVVEDASSVPAVVRACDVGKVAPFRLGDRA